MEFLKAQWREMLNIEIETTYVDYATYIESRRSSPVRIGGWIADYPDPDNFLRTSGLRRETNWQNDTFDRLIEKARRITDHPERMRLYQKADRLLVDAAVIIPLAYRQSHWLVKPWVKNFVVRNFLPAIWKDIIIDPH